MLSMTGAIRDCVLLSYPVPADGRTLDGLYFVRSDADSALVSWGGNL
jgi:hypothetical protein